MSLTREQWIEMWGQIKNIESLTNVIKTLAKGERTKMSCDIIQTELVEIKNKIESVIGQME